MDQITLVDRRIADGQKLLLQLAQDGFEVAAGFWLKAPDDTFIHLFIASKVVDQLGPGEAYRKVQQSQQKLQGICISLADVKLIGVQNPIMAGIRQLRKWTTGEKPLHFRGGQLGHLAVEEVYIYPPLARPKR